MSHGCDPPTAATLGCPLQRVVPLPIEPLLLGVELLGDVEELPLIPEELPLAPLEPAPELLK